MVNRTNQQTDLKEVLTLRLAEYSKQHDGAFIDWDDITQIKYGIAYKSTEDIFYAQPHNNYAFGTVCFYSREIATRAITDVVMPFIKEHPETIW